MNCADAERQLTAYLDGELADERGSALRGHLRTCAACRQVATDESALRDGLRQLPPVDPPPSLWAGVQAQLAAAEMRDAEAPSWRRAASRWSARLARSWPQFALGGVAAAAALTFVILRARGTDSEQPPIAPPVQSAHMATQPPSAPPPSDDDVTDDLAHEAARVTATYADTAEELLAAAHEVRPGWSTEQQQTFDARVAELRGAITSAEAGRPQQAAWRALIRYLQRAAIREEVALAQGLP